MLLSENKILSPFRVAGHRHQLCLQAALEAAQRQCAASGQRLTRLRQRVLELIWQSHEPAKAYDILDSLKNDNMSSAPPTVYRALDFLRQQGLVHKIESQNAYIGCGDPTDAHSGQFFICNDCGTVAEIDDADIRHLLTQQAAYFGFKIGRQMIEIDGCCRECLAAQKSK